MEATQAQKPKYIRVLREQINQSFDYIEALLGGSIFPRKAMPGFKVGQKIYFKKETLLEDFEATDFQDCFIASHAELDKELAVLKVVFLDFDNPNNLVGAIQEALKVAEHIKKEFNVVVHVQFSGSKGCHVVLPISPIEFESAADEKRFLFYFQSKLTKESNFADKQVFGDISRLIRVPYTINSKALDMPWHGYVKVLQEWNGNYADLSKDLQTWKVKKAIEESNTAQKPIVISPKGHIRKPVLELVERAEKGIHLTNNQRVAIALEYIANGYDDKEIAKIFEKQEDYGSGEKTLYHIRKLREGFERGDYKPFKTENLLKILEEVDEE
jgi:hypothetical protein